jgi:hypothetical protein
MKVTVRPDGVGKDPERFPPGSFFTLSTRALHVNETRVIVGSGSALVVVVVVVVVLVVVVDVEDGEAEAEAVPAARMPATTRAAPNPPTDAVTRRAVLLLFAHIWIPPWLCGCVRALWARIAG